MNDQIDTPESQNPETPRLGRRQLLAGAASLAGLAMAGPALAGSHGHGHGASGQGHGSSGQKAHAKHAQIVDAARECVRTGEICRSHCLETFRAGETMMADCAWSVEQMLPVCDAFAALATYDSPHLGDMAAGCLKVCEDCEKECRKHEKRHAECKDCAEACAELNRQLRALIG